MTEQLIGMRVFRGISGDGFIVGGNLAAGPAIEAGDRLQITWIGGTTFGAGGPDNFGAYAPADNTIAQTSPADLSTYWYSAWIYRQLSEED